MEAVVIILVIVVLGVLVGTGVALVRGRRGGDTTLEPPPSAPVVTGDDASAPPAEVAPVEQADVVAEAEAVARLPRPPRWRPAPTRPRFRDRLSKARGLLSGYVGSLTGRSRIDEAAWDELEEALIRADVGVDATQELLDALRAQVKEQGLENGAQLLDALKVELARRLGGFDVELVRAGGPGPSVWLFVGVNGVGKTTTIGKLGKREIDAGHKVVMAAGDTFRAAAAEQLGMWADRGAEIVRGNEGGDPGAVIFDAVEAATARGADLVLADTAGRLHTKVNLMDELRKVRRVADKGAGDVTEVLLVLDATTGQNGLVQAAQFTEAVDVTGVVLTKLDGSAKGGIVVAIQTQLGIPVKLVGLGEGVEDLVPFEADEFVEALFSVKVLMLPFHVVARLTAVSAKLVVATGEVAFRAGYLVGSVPVKGTAAAGRALGPKAVVLFVLGLVLGVVIGHRVTTRLGSSPAASGALPGPFDPSDLPDEVAVDV